MKFKPRLGAWSSGQSAALLIILLLATATRMFGLGDQSLWYDEAQWRRRRWDTCPSFF
jgi:predicted membrane-bound mannosyltransferase